MPRGRSSPCLSRVAQGALCSGCGGCALVAPGKISMQVAPPGFLRPMQSQPLEADEEARLARICPGLGQSVEPGGRTDDPLWGPYVTMRTGHATDPELRFAGASGGGLSGFLVWLIESGTVEAIVQTGADPQRPVANAPVISTCRDEVLAAAGSRYAPSAPLAGLAALRDDARRFAFVGKPCDAAALRALQGEEPWLAERFPVLVSFFCAGVPSLAGAEDVVRSMGADPADVAGFRYRGRGWPGRATATLDDGREVSMSYADSWGGILSHHVQHRCKVCADGTGVAADAVFADAWETDERGYPLFEERDGISLVVARTALGARLLDAAETAGHLATEPFDISRLDSIQPGQRGRRVNLFSRLAGLALTFRPYPRYRGLHILACARRTKPLTALRNFAGMVRRVLMGRVR